MPADDPAPPARRIPYARQTIDDADAAAVVEALRSDFVTQGPRVGWFEDALREATGARHAVVVSSGTAALHLACTGLGIGAGDFGVVPAITFAASANCLRYCGADVSFCDVDPRTGLTSLEAIAVAAGQGAESVFKVAIPVSYSGSAADLPAIACWAARRGAFVIEDAAHSIGGSYVLDGGETALSASCRHSDAATLSFHPVKHVCAGEGGAVMTNDETLARRVRRLRSHGIEKRDGWRYEQLELGYHYRMTELQAALGRSQLAKLGASVARRRALAARYDAAFAQAPFASRLRAASQDPLSARHLYVVHFESAATRAAAYAYLGERGIGAQVHYEPLYRHPYYALRGCLELPGAEAFYAGCLSLPMYPALADEEQGRVIGALRDFCEASAR